MQYTRQDWRNRNRVKTDRGTRWLTIPVTVDGLYDQRLDRTRIADPNWPTAHWEIVKRAYSDAPFFAVYAEAIGDTYGACAGEQFLSRINRCFLECINDLLGIRTPLRWSTDYGEFGAGTVGLVDLCRAAGADTYLSGPRGRDYIEQERFDEEGIELTYFEYDGYPEYRQRHGPFEHTISILDLLFNVGRDAPRYLKSFRTDEVTQ